MTSATATLLVELLTEELPPKALSRLGETFATRIAEGLKAKGLAPLDAAFRSYASPRRLAVTVAHVAAEGAASRIRAPRVSRVIKTPRQASGAEALCAR